MKTKPNNEVVLLANRGVDRQTHTPDIRLQYMNTCYMCGEVATTTEHVPPKSLFPEEKDLPPGYDLRRSLITVPSCKTHNTQKSKDDEYLALVLTVAMGNNQFGTNHFASKVMRALTRRPSLLALYRDLQPIHIHGRETGMFTIDNARFRRCVEHMVLALCFHDFQRKWPHPMFLDSPSLLQFENPKLPALLKAKREYFQTIGKHLGDAPQKGANPEIFAYRMTVLKPHDLLLAHLIFYEGCHIMAVSHPKMVKRKPDAGI